MNTGNEARKTPVQELLRGIPKDHVIQFETDDNGFKAWHNCPIGRIAHEAADALEAQQAENEALRTELEALRAMLPKWVPVTERLPINNDEVLVCDTTCTDEYGWPYSDWETMAVGFYEGGKWHSGLGADALPSDVITHWMPLPSPPTESKGNE